MIDMVKKRGYLGTTIRGREREREIPREVSTNMPVQQCRSLGEPLGFGVSCRGGRVFLIISRPGASCLQGWGQAATVGTSALLFRCVGWSQWGRWMIRWHDGTRSWGAVAFPKGSA